MNLRRTLLRLGIYVVNNIVAIRTYDLAWHIFVAFALLPLDVAPWLGDLDRSVLRIRH